MNGEQQKYPFSKTSIKCMFNIPVRGDPDVLHLGEHSNPNQMDKYFPTKHPNPTFIAKLHNFATCTIPARLVPKPPIVPKRTKSRNRRIIQLENVYTTQSRTKSISDIVIHRVDYGTDHSLGHLVGERLYCRVKVRQFENKQMFSVL